MFCKGELITNGRPVPSVSDDSDDAEVLTPNQLLLLRDEPSVMTRDSAGRKTLATCSVHYRSILEAMSKGITLYLCQELKQNNLRSLM